MISTNLNPDILLFANFDNVNEKEVFPEFYVNALRLWNEFVTTPVPKTQYIWLNKNIKIGGQCVFYEELHDAGLYYISDLFNTEGNLLPFSYWTDRGIRSVNYMRWAGIVTAAKRLVTPEIDMTIEKHSKPDSSLLSVWGQSVQHMNSKFVYCKLIEKKYGNAVSCPRVTKYIRTENVNIHECYQLLYKHVIDTKTREFQFKFLNDVLVNNYWLKKWKLKVSDECTFCKKESETILHLFWECAHVKRFWEDFSQYVYEKTDVVSDINSIFFGMLSREEAAVLYNTLVFNAKRYIHECRYNENVPDFTVSKFRIAYIN